MNVLDPLAALTVVCADDHFAPGPETLAAHVTVLNLIGHTVTVTVTDAGNVVAYTRQIAINADGDVLLNWSGQANQGPRAGQLITPLQSPYRIDAQVDNTALASPPVSFKVLYRSISLALGTYTANGLAPNQVLQPQQWVQYKLNELGYFAGPVNGIIADTDGWQNTDGQTQRALCRYAHENPTLRVSDATGPIYYQNLTLIAQLAAGACSQTIIQNNALPAAGNTAKLYMANNYYYGSYRNFDDPHGAAKCAREKLDRFEIPVDATITLLSRLDADGTQPGIASPGAVGDVQIQWLAENIAEDTNGLPTSVVGQPSHAKSYIDATWVELGMANCPASLGGSRVSLNPNVNQFRIGTQLPPYTSTAIGNNVYSTAHQGAGDLKEGKAGILFRGSYVAGDSYKLEAKLTFLGRPNAGPLGAAHLTALGPTWEDKLTAKTGTMTLWHRHRIAAEINWPAPNPLRAVNWAAVAAEYAHSYCELDYANLATMTGAAFLGLTDANGDTFNALWAPAIAAVMTEGFAALNGNALFPIAIPPQGTMTAKIYRQTINTLLNQKLTISTLMGFADGVAQYLRTQVPLPINQGRPGAVVIHAKWVPTIPTQHTGMFNKAPENYDPALFCIGLNAGVIIIANSMYPDDEDRFIITHELGHSRFMRHHETQYNGLSDNPGDHDQNDHNCTMSYPFGIKTRPNLTWAPGGANHSAFCGKCNLKLRGWDVAPLLPLQSV